jgi:hypothetical protein
MFAYRFYLNLLCQDSNNSSQLVNRKCLKVRFDKVNLITELSEILIIDTIFTPNFYCSQDIPLIML